MNGSFSIPPLVDSSLIAVLALAVLIFFVFAMVLYLRRCISTVSQQYQDAADLSSAVTMLKADKEKLEQYIAGQEEELRKVRGEREEQEELRQAILVQQDKLKGLRDAVEALTVMQVERKELEARMAERRSDLEKLEEQYQNALSMKESLPEVRREYEALQKELVKKAEIDTAITTGEARLKKLEELIPDREQRLNELQKEIGQKEEAQSELRQLKDDLTSLLRQKAEADAQFAALNTQIPALKKQSMDAENEYSSVSSKLQELKVRQQEEEEKKNEFEKKTAEAEQQLTSIRKQVAEANTEFTALNAQLPELRKQLEEQNQKVLNMKESLPEVRREYEALQKELAQKAEIDTAITTGETRLKKLEELIPEREQRLNELQKEIDQKEETQAELRQLKDDIASLLRQKAEFDAQFAALNTQIPTLKKQSLDAENECNSVSLKLQELKVRQQEEEEKKNEFEKKTAEAEQQLTSIREQVAKANTEFTALNAQLPELRKQVHEMGLQAQGVDTGKDEALSDLLRAPESLRSIPLVDEASEQDMLQDFTRALREARLQFPQRTINALHTSLKCQDINPLTVLAGVSGTGKTLLPVKYAEFMGINQIILSVQPRWDSAQDLFGFYNYLEKRYKATELARCLLRMDPYIGLFNTPSDANIRRGMLMVLLDEMNLARPEYYFSEFLSKLELRRTVDPRDQKSRSRASIEFDTGAGNKTYSVWVPDNILFVGTMNEDETTQTLSDKVLDRANVLRFGKPAERRDHEKPSMARMNSGHSISAKAWKSWKKNDIRQYADACSGWTKTLNNALSALGRAFGFRVEEAILSYVANYPGVRPNSREMRWAFADQVEQKILPKLRGCDMNLPAASSSLDQIERVIAAVDDEELLDAYRLALGNAKDTGIFLWQGVTRS
ncbi:MAG: hypothetical protein SPF94_00560 [Desulfovibrio sp.]|nr:hypothetical protein [Desulfovibrio sp.]